MRQRARLSAKLPMAGGIYVTGNIVADCLVQPVDSLPAWGSTTFVDSIDLHLGGNGAASAYAAGRMGVPVQLAGAVGEDSFGQFALKRLRGAAVDTSRVVVHSGVATATTIGLVNRKAERLFFHDPGASRHCKLGNIPFDPDTIGNCSYFHFGSIFCLPKLRDHAGELLQKARGAGLITSLDTDWDTDGRWMEDFKPLCPLLDYLFANRLEAKMLTGSADPGENGRIFRKLGAKVVVIKLGAAGCAVFSGQGDFSLPAYRVNAIDTTGAGDCFCGAFLAGLCRGLDLREAAQLGTAVGAQCVQHVGGTDWEASYESTRRWMESRENQ